MFGRNEKGQLGDGTLKATGTPTRAAITNETFVDAAVGRNHTILVAKSGSVYGCGENKLFQVGTDSPKEQKQFVRIGIPDDVKVAQVSCGADFTVAVTTDGQVYTWGNPQYGQCADGSEHGYIGSNNRMIYSPQGPKLVKALNGKTIVSVSCGTNHCLALDNEGQMYTWGCSGYGRLGLNETPPKDKFLPVEISGFKDRKNPVKMIACGATSSMCVDSTIF